jgi:hypothetical protein
MLYRPRLVWEKVGRRRIQEEGLYVENMHNIVEKHFRISIAPVQSQGRFLNKITYLKPPAPSGSLKWSYSLVLIMILTR